MRADSRENKTAVIVLGIILLAVLLLSGCGMVRPSFAGLQAKCPPSAPSAGQPLEIIGYWSLWGGALAIIAALVIGALVPRMIEKCLHLAAAGFVCIVGGRALVWLGGNMWVIAIGCVAMMVAMIWANRFILERFFNYDFTRNGKIGE